MRKHIVAGNWKMNKTFGDGIDLIEELNERLNASKVNCDVIIAPPFYLLPTAAQLTEGGIIKVSAQNCSDKASGAYTGEVSAAMIKSAGATHVIIGHSERRSYYGETDATVLAKVQMALSEGLVPIVCVGENLEEREGGKAFDVVKKQLQEGLFALSADEFSKVIIAYEPVWAIGTGKTATKEQAQEIHQVIRASVSSKYNATVADNLTILYGGSCKPSNAQELFSMPDVDGGLIGGASLKADDFMGIINAFE